MSGRSILIFIVGLSVAQQAASQSGYTDTSRLVGSVLIEKELLPDAKPTVRVYGEASAQEKAGRVTDVGSADAEIQTPN